MVCKPLLSTAHKLLLCLPIRLQRTGDSPVINQLEKDSRKPNAKQNKYEYYICMFTHMYFEAQI